LTRVTIETPVKPTENIFKIKAAVLNVFPEAKFIEGEGCLRAETSSLERLREMFRIQRIRDTARSVLRGAREGTIIHFFLNKQAACVGKVNFAPPSPLGPIEVIIEDEDVDKVIDFLTARTNGDSARPTRATG